MPKSSTDQLRDNLNEIEDIKGQIRQAIIAKETEVPLDTPFSEYPQKIEDIQTKEDLDDVLDTQDEKIAELEAALENKTAGGNQILEFNSIFNLLIGSDTQDTVREFDLLPNKKYLFAFHTSNGSLTNTCTSHRIFSTDENKIKNISLYDYGTNSCLVFATSGLHLVITIKKPIWGNLSLTEIPDTLKLYKYDDVTPNSTKAYNIEIRKNYILFTKFNDTWGTENITLISAGYSSGSSPGSRTLFYDGYQYNKYAPSISYTANTTVNVGNTSSYLMSSLFIEL